MRTSTLYHLFKGKRTSSVLSYAYFYDVCSFFSLFPRLDEKKYQMMIKELVSNQLLEERNGEVRLSQLGRDTVLNTNFPKTSDINQLSFYKWDLSFFDQLLFASQVLSEKAHENTNYIPIETSLYKQQQLKRWLKKQKKSVSSHFYEEWSELITHLDIEEQKIILSQLVGTDQIGLTLNQIAEIEKRDYVFNYLFFKNTWHKLIQLIMTFPTKYVLFNELLVMEIQAKKEDSSYLSSELFLKGHSIDAIANLRYLKPSTVTDHLIEEFIIKNDVENLPTFSKEVDTSLSKLLKQRPSFFKWTYKEALSYHPNLSFYDFRFYQFYLKNRGESID